MNETLWKLVAEARTYLSKAINAHRGNVAEGVEPDEEMATMRLEQGFGTIGVVMAKVTDNSGD